MKHRQEDLVNTNILRFPNLLIRDYATDVVEYLLAAECKPLGIPRKSSDKRAFFINWLVKVNGPDGNPAIIQSACWYLDTVLYLTHLEPNMLIAAACFWIAQKLDGTCMPTKKLVEWSSGAFTSQHLVAVEYAIMKELMFPKKPVVAEDYISYLCWLSETDNVVEIELAASFIAICGLMVDPYSGRMDPVLCSEYASVIATAAVWNALLLLGNEEQLLKLHSCQVFKFAEYKTPSLSNICFSLRRAVRTVSAHSYENKAPLEHYSKPPRYIAQRVIFAANELRFG